MKKILTLLFGIITMYATAQTSGFNSKYTYGTIAEAVSRVKADYYKVSVSDPITGGDFTVRDTADGYKANGSIVIAIPGTSKVMVRDLSQSDGLYSDWWDDNSDTTKDHYKALQAMLDYDYNNHTRTGIVVSHGLTYDEGGKWGQIRRVSVLHLRPGKIYNIRHPLVIRAGQFLDGHNSIITTDTTLPYLIITPYNGGTRTFWTGTDSAKGYPQSDRMYPQKNIVIENVRLDGNNLANGGLRWDCVSTSKLDHVIFERFTKKNWQDTTHQILQNQVIGDWVRVSTTAGMQPGNAIRIQKGATGVYSTNINKIIKVHGDTVFFQRTKLGETDTAQAGDYIDDMPVAFMAGQTQSGMYNLQFRYNYTPIYAAEGINNATGGTAGDSGDNRWYNTFVSENELGIVVFSGSQHFIGGTAMHSVYENLIIRASSVGFYNSFYVEIGVNFKGQNNERYPLIYLQGRDIRLDIFCPSNNNQFGFFRRVYMAKNTQLALTWAELSGGFVRQNDSAIVVNADDTLSNGNPGTLKKDIAIVKMYSPVGSNLEMYLRSIKNVALRDSVIYAVVDTGYNPVTKNILVHSVASNGQLTQKGDLGIDSLPFYSFFSTPQAGISAGGLYVNDGFGNYGQITKTRNGYIGAGFTTKWEFPSRWNYPIRSGPIFQWRDSTTGTYGFRMHEKLFTGPTSDTDSVDVRTPGFMVDTYQGFTDVWAGSSPIVTGNQISIYNAGNGFLAYKSATRTDTFSSYRRLADTAAAIRASITSGNASVKPQVSIIALGATGVAASTVAYAIPGSGTSSTAENARQFAFPVAGTVSNLVVYTSSVQPATGGVIYTVRKNSVAAAVTTTIAASATAGKYTDLTHTVHFSALDDFSVEIANAASATSAGIKSITFTFTPD